MDIIPPMSAVTDGIHGINATGAEDTKDMYAVKRTHACKGIHVYRGYICGSGNEEHDK